MSKIPETDCLGIMKKYGTKFLKYAYVKNKPIGYWMQLRNHPRNCSCMEKARGGICPKLFICTCDDYCYKNEICIHIESLVYSTPPEQLRILCKQKELNYLCVTDIIFSRTTHTRDKFPYGEFFRNFANFNLKLGRQERTFYWDGYEHMLKRHEMGQEIGKNSVTETTENKIWSVKETVDGLNSFNYVSLLSDTCLVGLYCSAFKKCSVCWCCKHMYSCTCDDFMSGFVCRHCHAVAMTRFNRFNTPYAIKDMWRYYRDALRRCYFLNMHTRARHNAAIFLSCVQADEGFYVEDSYTESQTKYKVECWNEECDCGESKKCIICDICWHTFKCQCRDYSKGFLCYHVHSARMLSLRVNRFIDRLVDNVSQCGIDSDANLQEVVVTIESYNVAEPSCSGLLGSPKKRPLKWKSVGKQLQDIHEEGKDDSDSKITVKEEKPQTLISFDAEFGTYWEDSQLTMIITPEPGFSGASAEETEDMKSDSQEKPSQEEVDKKKDDMEIEVVSVSSIEECEDEQKKVSPEKVSPDVDCCKKWCPPF